MQNIPIFLSSDNNYAPFVATTIASICNNTKSFSDFYILDGGINNENRKKIESLKNKFNNFTIEFIKIDLEQELNTIDYKNACNHVTISTYNRFLIPKIKPNIQRLLYLDVDIIVMKDIRQLYEQDLKGFALGAIPEDFEGDSNAVERNQVLGLNAEHKYFNAGVLLIDNEKWVSQNLIQQLFNTEIKYRNILKWADQDVLNIVFNNHYAILDSKFNYMTQNKEKKQDLVLRHYNTFLKPWLIHPDLDTPFLQNIKDFWHYASMTPFYEELKQATKLKNQLQLRVFELSKKGIKNA